MKKSYIAIAVASQLIVYEHGVYAASLTESKVFSDAHTVLHGDYQPVTSEVHWQGKTGSENILFDGAADEKVNNGIIKVQSSTSPADFIISDFGKITFDNSPRTNDGLAIANWWSKGKIQFKNVDNILIGTESSQYKGSAVQALGGRIDFLDIGNLYINATGNGLYLQQTNSDKVTDANLTVKASGVVSVITDSSAVGVQHHSVKNTKSSSVSVEADSINIRSHNGLGVFVQDYVNANSTPPHPTATADTDLAVNLKSRHDISIQSDAASAIDVRDAADNKYKGSRKVTVASSDGVVSVNGATNGINVGMTDGSSTTVEKSVSITGPVVQISGGDAAVAGQKNSTIGIKADSAILSGGAQSVFLGEQGKLALSSLNETSRLSASLRGDVNASSGSIDLQHTDVDLQAGSKIHVSELTGNDSSITVNELLHNEDTVRIAENKISNLLVNMSASANDRYGDATVASSAMAGALDITNKDAGSYILNGRSGAISDAWTADAQGNITSRKVNQSLDVFNNYNAMTLVQWRNETSHINQRLGDLRNSPDTAGSWARVYGYNSAFDNDNVSIKFKTTSIQVGGDYRLNNIWLVGGALSYTDGHGSFSNGYADSGSYSVAAYLSGFFENGGYIDVMGRIGRLSTDIVSYSDTSTFRGSYDNTAYGLSAEAGYHWKAVGEFYLEPLAGLDWGVVKGDDFTGENHVRISQSDFRTLVGRAGIRTGLDFAEGAGNVYAHATVNHEFQGNADYKASFGNVTRDFNTDVDGSWVSYGIGAQYKMPDNLNLYGTLERSSGTAYDEDYRYSLGISYRF